MCPIVSLAAKETMREGTEIKFHLQNDHKKKMWLERKMELKQNRNDKKIGFSRTSINRTSIYVQSLQHRVLKVTFYN